MIDIKRPNIFPQCASCTVASGEILKNTGPETTEITIRCFKVNLILRQDIRMTTSVTIVNQFSDLGTPLTSEKSYSNVVTDKCPGWRAERLRK